MKRSGTDSIEQPPFVFAAVIPVSRVIDDHHVKFQPLCKVTRNYDRTTDILVPIACYFSYPSLILQKSVCPRGLFFGSRYDSYGFVSDTRILATVSPTTFSLSSILEKPVISSVDL